MLSTGLCRPALAQEPGDAGAHSEADSQQHPSESHETHHKNVVAVFVGITNDGRRSADPALGIEYERRISEQFGIGAIVERTFADNEFMVYAVPFAFHAGPLKLYVAPGVEEKDNHTEELIRLGVEYGFEVGRYEISPQFDIDFVGSEEVYVLGVTFGLPF